MSPAGLLLIDDAGQSRVHPGRVFCVTRNYSAHAREMGADPAALPSIFCKLPTSLVDLTRRDRVPYPPHGSELHHEAEIVILALDPHAGIFAYGAGVDLTLRDIQGELKRRGLPWEAAKAFDASGPVGAFFLLDLSDSARLRIDLSVNNDPRQDGSASDMIISLSDIPAYVSEIFPLRPGDLVFTGTPQGVGPLERGDRVEITLQRRGDPDPLDRRAFTIV